MNVFAAVLSGEVEFLKELFRKSPNSVNSRDSSRCTPLHYAAVCGRSHIAELLLEYGADVNSMEDRGRTPLIFAACYGSNSVISVLLRMIGKHDVNRFDNDEYTTLHWAAQSGFPGTCELLLQNGADIDALNCLHKTPLLIAVQNDDLKCAEVLVSCGCDVNVVDNNGCSALLFTCLNGNNLKMCAFLVEHGADVSLSTPDGLTSLHAAARVGNADMIHFILDHEAVVDIRDLNGRTPLMEALSSGELSAAQVLVSEFGANIFAKDSRSKTCLHYATEGSCTEMSSECMKYILSCIEKGGDRVDFINSKDDHLFSPLDKAVSRGNVECTRVLEEAGADGSMIRRVRRVLFADEDDDDEKRKKMSNMDKFLVVGTLLLFVCTIVSLLFARELRLVPSSSS